MAVLLLGSVAALVQKIPLPPVLSVARANAPFDLRLAFSGGLAALAAVLSAGLLTRRPGQSLILAALGLCGLGIAAAELEGASIDRALSHRASLIEVADALSLDDECVALGFTHKSIRFYFGKPVILVSEIEEIHELRRGRTRPLYVLASADTDLPESALELKEEKTELASKVAWLDDPLGLWALDPDIAAESPRDLEPGREPAWSPLLPEMEPMPPPEPAPEPDATPRAGVQARP